MSQSTLTPDPSPTNGREGFTRPAPRRCDIFCTVVDNFGDIGVCWRLARQLSNEYGWHIRLWVDDLHTFAKIAPSVQSHVARQFIGAIEIRYWHATAFEDDSLECAQVVIEAFACELPQPYLLKMAAQATQQNAPAWINLEYLSAQDWVADFHLRTSPHPRYALRKSFFFPGLQTGSGGVLCEQGLFETRRAWLADAVAQTRLWEALGVAAPAASAMRVSLFCYANPALPTLLHVWRNSAQPVVCFIPQRCVPAEATRFLKEFAQPCPHPDTVHDSSTWRAGSLTVHTIPFTEQDSYDRLLWACDLNFVRGEDSFVRAQWAERPFVWQIYPQVDHAHRPKLEAVLNRYSAALPETAHEALAAFWRAWNSYPNACLDWQSFWQHHDKLAQHARSWPRQLVALGNLAANLVQHVEGQFQRYNPGLL